MQGQVNIHRQIIASRPWPLATLLRQRALLQRQRVLSLCLLTLLLCLPPVAKAATPAEGRDGGVVTLRGTVRDRETRLPLPYAAIGLGGTDVGTVSNADGEFVLKVDLDHANSSRADAALGDGAAASEGVKVIVEGGTVIEVSHLGYRTSRIAVDAADASRSLTIWLSPVSLPLSEIIAISGDARTIVDQALSRIDQNYTDGHRLLTAFYRETARKRRHYISVAEAVIEVSKSPYLLTQDIATDRVRIHRGRKLLSQKPSDTLAIKLQGGPTLAVQMDIVKNPDQILAPDLVDCFHYRLQSIALIGDRQVYVVAFSPRVILDFPLYSGHYYIDVETLTLTRAEYSMDLADLAKATQAILRRKPTGLRFRPMEVAYVVDYRLTESGRSRLHYVRNEITFRCDWRRRLFATEYSVVAEMVVTDSRHAAPHEIPAREQFSRTQVFTDDATFFFDPDFWGDYNIIAPDESLEHAVRRLTKGRRQ